MNDELQYELTRLLRRVNDTISGPEALPMTQLAEQQVFRLQDHPDCVPFCEFVRLWEVHQGLIPSRPSIKEAANWLEVTASEPARKLQMFRHGGSSTLVCLYVAWSLFRDPDRTFVYVCATQQWALCVAEFIRSVLENHPYTGHLVPAYADEWNRNHFTVNRSTKTLDPSVRVIGMNSDFADFVADELIADSVVTAFNTKTTGERSLTFERIRDFAAMAPKITYIVSGEVPTLRIPANGEATNG